MNLYIQIRALLIFEENKQKFKNITSLLFNIIFFLIPNDTFISVKNSTTNILFIYKSIIISFFFRNEVSGAHFTL